MCSSLRRAPIWLVGCGPMRRHSRCQRGSRHGSWQTFGGIRSRARHLGGILPNGYSTPAIEYSRAIAACQLSGLDMAKFHQRYDVILGPTLAKPPVPLGILSLSRKDVQGFFSDMSAFQNWAWLFNVTGQPSMSVPLYWTAEGLPIGVMFSARFGDEATLFRLASQLEKARPWVKRRPVV